MFFLQGKIVKLYYKMLTMSFLHWINWMKK